MLTMCCILLLNMLFTYSYHWPLSHLNYGLQLSGVVTMLMVFITSFHVILTHAAVRSRQWPYMLDYVAISIPPDNWNSIAIAWWYGLLALGSGLVHVSTTSSPRRLLLTPSYTTLGHPYPILNNSLSIESGSKTHPHPACPSRRDFRLDRTYPVTHLTTASQQALRCIRFDSKHL